MTLGERLAILRKSKGLSQEQLADELYLTRQTISKWELNQSAPDITYILKLSDYFAVSTDYILRGDEFAHTENCNTSIGLIAAKSKFKTTNTCEWLFYLGLMLIILALTSIIAITICSTLKPHGTYINGKYIDGILGFFLATNTLWLLLVLVAMLIVGCCLTAISITKNKRNKVK